MWAGQQRISVVNVDLRRQQSRADRQERLIGVLGQFDGQEFRFAEREAPGPQQLPAKIGLGTNEANQSRITRFFDRQSDDSADTLLQRTNQRLEPADLILQKNGELPHARRFKPGAILRLRRQNLFHNNPEHTADGKKFPNNIVTATSNKQKQGPP